MPGGLAEIVVKAIGWMLAICCASAALGFVLAGLFAKLRDPHEDCALCHDTGIPETDVEMGVRPCPLCVVGDAPVVPVHVLENA